MDEHSAHYTVLARRFRPQSFGDVVGQEHVAQALRNAITSERVAHAYLFTGARGVGKTSTARILAKSLNCPNAVAGDPCNDCEVCESIASGSDVDVLEIDGASNRGIDDIRSLRANVNIKSMRSRFKIYIIDEVHMLTKEAFNALLKTLEEPPPSVKFIFCTTEPNKLPDTILSRCQRFDFGTIQTHGWPRLPRRRANKSPRRRSNSSPGGRPVRCVTANRYSTSFWRSVRTKSPRKTCINSWEPPATSDWHKLSTPSSQVIAPVC